MAKTKQEILAVVDDAAAKFDWAGNTFDSIQALFEAIAELCQGNATVYQLACLGAGMAEDQSAHTHCACNELNALTTTLEAHHG